MSLVSVIMPSYNHEKYISEAIESVLNQSHKDLELIIVDDASKDSSKEVIRSYQERDNRIRAIFHSNNQGIAKTVNRGMKEASGKFIAFLSSDDIWLEQKLEKQLEVLRKNEDLVVWSDALIIDAQSNPVEELVAKRYNISKRKKTGNLFKELLKGSFVYVQSVILKKGNIQDIRFDGQLKYVNDYKFTLDLARKYKYYFIPGPLVKYRIHAKDPKRWDVADQLKDFALIGKYLLEEYGNELTNKVKAKFLFRIGCDACYQGDLGDGRKYVLKAIMTYPFRIRYLKFLVSSFGRDSVMRKSLKRRVSRK